MNREDLRRVQSYHGFPAISLMMPTHRFHPDTQQDPPRLRNLIRQTEQQLTQSLTKREATPYIGRLEKLQNELNFRQLLDGLVVFVSKELFEYHLLPFPVPEGVIIDDTFHTRFLVKRINRAARYWVLLMSENGTRLFEGHNRDLTEIQEGGFPLVHTEAGGQSSLPGGMGVRISAYRDERHRQFFRQVDNTLARFLTEDALPLVTIGVVRYHAFFKEVTRYKDFIVGEIHGNYDHTALHELGKMTWPLVRDHLESAKDDVLRRFRHALHQNRGAVELGEVYRHTVEGRVQTLLVEEEYAVPGHLDPSSGTLIPNPGPDSESDGLQAAPDAVDEVVEAVLQRSGEVFFYPPGTLEQYQRIAAILRY